MPEAREAAFMKAACKYVSVLDFSQGLGHREQLTIDDQGVPIEVDQEGDPWGLATEVVGDRLNKSGAA